MQRRFFKTSDLHDLFSLNEGTSDKTESSAIFAGTNSEVKPKKRSRRDRPEKEPVEKYYSFKIEKPKKQDHSKIINSLIGRDTSEEMENKIIPSVEKFKTEDIEVKREEETDKEIEEKKNEAETSLEDAERERLREKVRQINLKFSQKKFSKETSSDRDEKLKRRHHHRRSEKGAKFEGKVRVPNLVKCREYVGVNPESNSEVDRKQNDYVLQRLFKKTGVHSAMQVF
jgi:hypothetical protein